MVTRPHRRTVILHGVETEGVSERGDIAIGSGQITSTAKRRAGLLLLVKSNYNLRNNSRSSAKEVRMKLSFIVLSCAVAVVLSGCGKTWICDRFQLTMQGQPRASRSAY